MSIARNALSSLVCLMRSPDQLSHQTLSSAPAGFLACLAHRKSLHTVDAQQTFMDWISGTTCPPWLCWPPLCPQLPTWVQFPCVPVLSQYVCLTLCLLGVTHTLQSHRWPPAALRTRYSLSPSTPPPQLLHSLLTFPCPGSACTSLYTSVPAAFCKLRPSATNGFGHLNLLRVLGWGCIFLPPLTLLTCEMAFVTCLHRVRSNPPVVGSQMPLVTSLRGD